jgi:hypothetical protein
LPMVAGQRSGRKKTAGAELQQRPGAGRHEREMAFMCAGG